MTKHSPTTAPVFTDKMPVVRRDGRRFRRFNPITARMSPWFSDAPQAQVETPVTVAQTFVADTLKRMRKPELQGLATARGVKFNSKTTADALRAALSA